MVNISEKEFYFYKDENKVFPVFLKVNGDELTPIGIYYNLKGENRFLLESIYSEKEIGRYSFIGMNPYMKIRSYKEKIELENNKKLKKYKGKVLDFIKPYLISSYDQLDLNIPFLGGAVGYVGYDIAGQCEDIPCTNQDEINTPESYLMFYKSFICYDHFKHDIYLIYNVMENEEKSYTDILLYLEFLRDMVTSENTIHKLNTHYGNTEFQSNVTEKEFNDMVEKGKNYIKSGDIFQVVLSQRLKFKNDSHPFDVYRRLRSKNPSPYLFYVDFGDFQIAGSSPESLVTVKDGMVSTNPIAGTRKRGKNDTEDIKLKEELLRDEKETAEHVMLVDLGRNDIGKISKFGTVKVDKFMDVDFYSHVMHIVSSVSGELREDFHYLEALKSCLPVGTVSGAPKIRAMEIIDELENTKRGIYAGAVGYFSLNGNMDTCIAIRTIVFKNNYAYVQAGAGIVYDSVSENEYKETLNKAMAMKEVI